MSLTQNKSFFVTGWSIKTTYIGLIQDVRLICLSIYTLDIWTIQPFSKEQRWLMSSNQAYSRRRCSMVWLIRPNCLISTDVNEKLTRKHWFWRQFISTIDRNFQFVWSGVHIYYVNFRFCISVQSTVVMRAQYYKEVLHIFFYYKEYILKFKILFLLMHPCFAVLFYKISWYIQS